MSARDLPAGEAALIERAASRWFHDPLAFVLEAFDWGRGELTGEPGPDDWQSGQLRDIAQALRGGSGEREALRMATSSGHGVGKSALVAWLALWAMSTRPHLSGVITANTGIQLETKTWRELAIWHKRSITAHWFRWTATKFAHVDHPETWFIAAVPWSRENSEAFAGQHGEHVLIIYDEASAIDDIIWEVSEGATTTAGAMWFAFGNPTRNTGRFRQCWGRFRHRWITRQVDARAARKANQAQLQQWIEDYGIDSDFVRVRVLGLFPRASSAQFIPTDIVEAATTRPVDPDDGAPLLVGVDVARFGDDCSVIRFRKGRDARSIPPEVYRGMDMMQLAARVVHAMTRLPVDAVFIDGNGVGGGVVDRVKQLGYQVFEVQAGQAADGARQYANKRAECWARMREWLAVGSIDASQALVDDLIGPEFGFDRDQRIILERKDDMKKRGLASPDNGDALALTFAENVARRDHPRSIIARPTFAQSDYSLFGS